jgi:hypothetical protein
VGYVDASFEILNKDVKTQIDKLAQLKQNIVQTPEDLAKLNKCSKSVLFICGIRMIEIISDLKDDAYDIEKCSKAIAEALSTLPEFEKKAAMQDIQAALKNPDMLLQLKRNVDLTIEEMSDRPPNYSAAISPNL